MAKHKKDCHANGQGRRAVRSDASARHPDHLNQWANNNMNRHISPNLRRSSVYPAASRLSLACFAFLCVTALAGLLPKFLKQVPRELHGEYRLLVKLNPDKTRQVFTNPPPFATISSNRITLAASAIRSVERVMRVTPKGTNVYLLSFGDKSSWLITEAGSPNRLVVLEPSKTNSKSATTLVISRHPTNDVPTNRPPGL